MTIVPAILSTAPLTQFSSLPRRFYTGRILTLRVHPRRPACYNFCMAAKPIVMEGIPNSMERGIGAGILPAQDIRMLLEHGHVHASVPVPEENIQPASLDLRLGSVAYRVQASFLPGAHSTVEDKLGQLGMATLDLSQKAILEKGCVYIVPLMEELALPPEVTAKANPKSTTGRLDIFVRLITDHGVEFENVPASYTGRLYAEIVPRTFTVAVRAGMRLNQLRFVYRNPPTTDSMLVDLDKLHGLVFEGEEGEDKLAIAHIDRGLTFSINLKSHMPGEILAYKARKNAPLIDLDKVDHYVPEDFWEMVRNIKDFSLVLDPGDFYILASKEKVRVPGNYAAEMVPFDPAVGEFRVHYAGFFDPGFGYGDNDIKGTPAVLEVRAHEVPFLIEHGQIVGRLVYFPLMSTPDKIYGKGIGSSYQQQALTLSKQFRK
jgi:dCTP deaminase